MNTENRPCYRCGKNPAAGYASTWTAADGERWYCHGDDDESPTCYEQGQRSHHPDCPALYFADHPERCRCIFLAVLDGPGRSS